MKVSSSVSVVVATYNGAEFVAEQIDSILSQKHQPDEVICCDDGSVDDTLRILEEIRAQSSIPIRIVRNPVNLGFTQTFAGAAALACGELVFFSDQDDVWYPNKVTRVLEFFEENPAMMVVVHDGRLVNEHGEWHGATMLGQVRSGWGNDTGLVMGAMTATRRSFLQHALPIPPGIVGHDIWLHILAGLLHRRAVLPLDLQLIRRHSRNTSAWIASSVTPITAASVYLTHWRTSPAASYEDRLHRNRCLISRLEALRNSDTQLFSASELESALGELSGEKSALEQRARLVALGPIRRRVQASRMLAKGAYKHFNGVQSFLRDLTR